MTTIKRTAKVWTEPCKQCGGTGHVQKRERFSLWTPDEYDHAQPLDPKFDAPKDAYVCIAAPGASVFEAVKEGIELSKLAGRTVAFEFNGAVAICRHDSDWEAVSKEWWKRAYGKTYEQSMAER